jgi:hypothetical protein
MRLILFNRDHLLFSLSIDYIKTSLQKQPEALPAGGTRSAFPAGK